MGLGEPLGVLLDEGDRLQLAGDPDEIGRDGVLDRFPLELHDLGAFGEGLALGRKAFAVGLHHHVVGGDDLDAGFGLAGRHRLPGLVSLELRERETAGDLQGRAVLRREREAAGDDDEDC